MILKSITYIRGECYGNGWKSTDAHCTLVLPPQSLALSDEGNPLGLLEVEMMRLEYEVVVAVGWLRGGSGGGLPNTLELGRIYKVSVK